MHISWEGGSTSATSNSTSTSTYPPDLRLLIDLMDLKGRELIRCLQKSSSESARTNCKDTYRPWAGYNRAANNSVDERKGGEKGQRRRRINSDGDSEDEDGDEGCSVSYDSDRSESEESIASDDDDDDVSGSDTPSDGDDNEGEDGGDKAKGSKSKRRTKGLPIISKRSESTAIPSNTLLIKSYNATTGQST